MHDRGSVGEINVPMNAPRPKVGPTLDGDARAVIGTVMLEAE